MSASYEITRGLTWYGAASDALRQAAHDVARAQVEISRVDRSDAVALGAIMAARAALDEAQERIERTMAQARYDCRPLKS